MSTECEPVRNALYLPIHSLALQLARRKAAQLAYLLGLPRADREDIAQDVLTQVLMSLRAFDNSRSTPPTFVPHVVDNKAITIIRFYTARKRAGRVVSIETVPDRGDDPVDGGSIEPAARLNCWRWADDEWSLRIDVARALAKLPPELRQTAWSLAVQNRAEAARQLGLSRAVLDRRIAKLRVAFVEHGLHRYVLCSPCRRATALSSGQEGS